jgi:hypothetical protein
MPSPFAINSIPPDIVSVLQAKLKSFKIFTDAGLVLQQALHSATSGLPVYSMDLGDVMSTGKGLSGAAQAGWRIVAKEGDETIAADIYTMARPGEYPLPAGSPRLACVRQSPEVLSLLTIMEDLQTPPLADRLPTSTSSLRLLILPGLFTEAFWIQPSDDTAPMIVPYYTLVKGVKVGEPYSVKEFFNLLQSTAQVWVTPGMPPNSGSNYGV